MYAGLESKNTKHRIFNAPGFVHTNREVAEQVKKYVKECRVEYVQSNIERWDKRVLPRLEARIRVFQDQVRARAGNPPMTLIEAFETL